MLGVKYFKNGFYQEKNRIIHEAINKYANAKNDSTLNEKQLNEIKTESEEILGKIMVENGFRENDNNFISMDKEFFDEYGGLDDKKVAEFKKSMIKYYALDDIKWTFAGTTSNYTQITKKSLKERGFDYVELLPVDLKRKYLKNEQEKHKSGSVNATSIFIYPDGSVSNKYDQEKAKITFTDLQDNSGFDWTKGYSPDNKVIKKGWTAGFNDKMIWEKIKLDQDNLKVEITNTTSPVISFSQTPVAENQMVFINIPEMEETILFDEDGRMMDGGEEKYYSITGELYGVREIDTAGSIEGIKKAFSKQGIKSLNGIVVKDKSKETINYYKSNLKDYITGSTKFYTRQDKELTKKLTELKNYRMQKDTSSNLITGLLTLSSNGVKGEDLYNGLIPAVEKTEYETTLNIFDNKNDLDAFVSIPKIKEELDEESKSYLYNIDVPSGKKEELSNAVQNILHDYKNLSKHINMQKVNLLKAAYDTIVSGSIKSAGINIVSEKNLFDFIKNGIKTNAFNVIDYDKVSKQSISEELSEIKNIVSKKAKSLDINNVSKKNPVDFIKTNIFNEADYDKWISTKLSKQNISTESINEIKNKLKTINIPDNKQTDFNMAFQNTFESYKSIAASTGIKPVELVDAIKEIITNNNDSYKNKNIYFEKPLAEFIKESGKYNNNKIIKVKEDVYFAKKSERIEKPLDLTSDRDLNIFALSPIMSEQGINENDKTEFVNYLKTVNIPVNRSLDFSRSVINAVNMYKTQIAPKGINPLQAVKSIAQSYNGGYNKLADNVKEVVVKTMPAGASATLSTPGINADRSINLFNKNELEEFVKLPEFKNSGLLTSQFDNLIKMHSTEYVNLGMQNDYIKSIPVRFREKINVPSIDRMQLTGIDLPREYTFKSIPNDIFNLGWFTKQYSNAPLSINYTNFGKSLLTPVTQDKINFIANYNSKAGENDKINYLDIKKQIALNGGASDMSIDQIIQIDKTSGLTESKMEFLNPFNYFYKKGGTTGVSNQNMNLQNTVNNMNQNISQPPDKMQRIEQNYYNDKKALAKGNEGPVETGGIKTTANDKVINEISDELIEEIKKKKNDI